MRKILALLGFVVFTSQAGHALDMVYPAGKYNKTVHDSVYFMGSLAPNESLYYQGEKVKATKNGAFAFTVPLVNGKNQVFLRVCKDGRYSLKQYYITKERAPLANSTDNALVPLNKTVFKTVKDNVPLRSTPIDAGINRMGHLAKDTQLIIDGRKGDFFRVYLSPTKYGWVSNKDVAVSFNANGSTKKPTLATFYNIDDKMVQNLSLYRAAFSYNLPFEVIDTPKELVINIFNIANVNEETLVLRVSKTENIKYSTNFTNGDFILLLKNPVKTPGQALSGLKIAIDAGHGGQELGALGVFREYEKDYNLKIALELKKQLEQKGANVTLTRSADTDVDLEERVKIAKAADSDIFLSIHLNSVPQGADPNARKGSSVYYYNESARRLAESIKNSMTTGLQTNDDGVHQASFAVIRPTDYLGVLAEVCYMVNPEDSEIYKSNTFIADAAKSITEGVVNYVSGNVTSKTDVKVSAKGEKSTKNEKNAKIKKEKTKQEKPFIDTSVREKYKQEKIYVIDKEDTKWYRPNGKKKRAKRPPRQIKNSVQTEPKEINIFASGDYSSTVIQKTPVKTRCRNFFSKLGSYFYNGAKN